MKNKIGVGVVTCRSENRLKQCTDKIPDVDAFVIVNDSGYPYPSDTYDKRAHVIEHSKNKCVGIFPWTSENKWSYSYGYISSYFSFVCHNPSTSLSSLSLFKIFQSSVINGKVVFYFTQLDLTKNLVMFN